MTAIENTLKELSELYYFYYNIPKIKSAAKGKSRKIPKPEKGNGKSSR